MMPFVNGWVIQFAYDIIESVMYTIKLYYVTEHLKTFFYYLNKYCCYYKNFVLNIMVLFYTIFRLK